MCNRAKKDKKDNNKETEKLNVKYKSCNDEDIEFSFNINSNVITELTNKENTKHLGYFKSKTKTIENFFKHKDIEKYYRIRNVYRYDLQKIENSNDYELWYYYEDDDENKKSDNDLTHNKNFPSILLILESPHKDEYTYGENQMTPVALANGKTGDGIYDNLDLVFNDIIKKLDSTSSLDANIYRVIIYNPIPYQTSLHFLHRQSLTGIYSTLRNNVWKGLWKNDTTFKNGMITLIKDLKPSLIINACTAGVTEEVNDVLKVLEEKTLLFSTYHPSSWGGFGIEEIK